MSNSTEIRANRLNKIREFLEEKPASNGEIKKYVMETDTVSSRTIDNDLKELRILNIIELNKNGLYHIVKKYIPNYDSKHKFELALKHSKNLILNDIESEYGVDVGVAYTDPNTAVDLITLFDRENNSTSERILYESIYQHLITGYPDIKNILSSYREYLISKGYDVSKDMQGIPYLNYYTEELKNRFKISEEEYTKNNLNIEIREKLGQKIVEIVAVVKNGSPLKGYCDYCPGR